MLKLDESLLEKVESYRRMYRCPMPNSVRYALTGALFFITLGGCFCLPPPEHVISVPLAPLMAVVVWVRVKVGVGPARLSALLAASVIAWFAFPEIIDGDNGIVVWMAFYVVGLAGTSVA
jgi:hypothetical protein